MSDPPAVPVPTVPPAAAPPPPTDLARLREHLTLLLEWRAHCTRPDVDTAPLPPPLPAEVATWDMAGAFWAALDELETLRAELVHRRDADALNRTRVHLWRARCEHGALLTRRPYALDAPPAAPTEPIGAELIDWGQSTLVMLNFPVPPMEPPPL